MNSDLGYVNGMRQAGAALVEHARGHPQASLEADRKTRSAVLYEIVVIGEGVKRLSPDFRALYPAVPWKRIAGTRDRVIHSFDEIDPQLIWEVAEVHIPRFLLDLDEIEAREQDVNP
jgi:uncharacterized protein with HEPN domain